MKFRLASFLFLPFADIAADTNALPALAPAYGELPPTFWEQHESAIVIGIFTLLALVFFFLKVILRPESSVVLPPQVLARKTLAKLQGRPEDGKLLSEASQALRRYVVATFELPPAEMTTAEFCAALAGNKKIAAELAQNLSGFLRVCDERKFSTLPAAAPLNVANRAIELIASAEKHRENTSTAQ